MTPSHSESVQPERWHRRAINYVGSSARSLTFAGIVLAWMLYASFDWFCTDGISRIIKFLAAFQGAYLAAKS